MRSYIGERELEFWLPKGDEHDAVVRACDKMER